MFLADQTSAEDRISNNKTSGGRKLVQIQQPLPAQIHTDFASSAYPQ